MRNRRVDTLHSVPHGVVVSRVCLETDTIALCIRLSRILTSVRGRCMVPVRVSTVYVDHEAEQVRSWRIVAMSNVLVVAI